MPRTLCLLLGALLVGAGAQAATINTTITVTNAPVTIGASIGVTGAATLTTIGSGTFTTTISLTGSGVDAQGNVTAPFTITLTGGAGTITGTFKVPLTLLTGSTTSATASIAVAGGTYGGGVTGGSFATVNATVSGGLATSNLALSFTGAGTVVTSGTSGGGGTTPTGPTITAVQDAGNYTSNVAPGSVFVVKGSNLSASGYTPFSFPLPTSSSGVKITFTAAGAGSGTDAYLVYLYNQGGVNQLAAILPSSVAPGSYNVTVTNGSTSAPVPVTVVQRKTELLTQDASGSGLAAAQVLPSYNLDRFTTGSVSGIAIAPAAPGQSMVVYATGMGAVTSDTTEYQSGSAGYDFTKNGVTVNVVVGGTSVPALYAGRTPSAAGLDQINFTLPSNVTTGCTVSLQVSVNGQLSNSTFISIAPNSGANACVQPGYTTQQLQDFDNGKVIYSGGFSISQFGITTAGQSFKSGTIGGGFYATTGFQLGSAPQGSISSTQIGSCTVTQTTGTGTSGGGSATGLDAGTVTMTGPGISGNLTVTQDPATKTYSLLIGAGIGANVSIGAGTYAINGAGGADVGSFNASLTVGPPLTITGGLPSAVNRSAGLTLNWTGGNASDFVEIFGSSSSGSGANSTTTAFVCLTTAGPGTFTVPSSVLTQLPAVTASATGSGGILAVESGPTPSTFSAPLKAGGSITGAAFSALVGAGALVSYQ
jgi:uncharacterized protein (TIGR03437 family)